MTPRAVLFDLFGTLVEVDAARLPPSGDAGGARPSTFGRWRALLEEYVGPRRPADVAAAFVRAAVRADATVEVSSRDRFRRALELLGCPATVLEEAAVVLSRAHMAALVEATTCPPGYRAVVAAAGRVGRVGIVSNFDDTGAAYAMLARHGLLELVDAVVVSEAVGRRKPHPLPVLAALRSLDVRPADAVFVGDGACADVGAARAAGVRPVLIAPEGADVGPDVRVVARLGDLPGALGW